MKYLAILFATDVGGSGQTLSCSATITVNHNVSKEEIKKKVLKRMMRMAKIKKQDVDTLLLVRNGVFHSSETSDKDGPPEVFMSWSAGAGDF